MSALFVEDLWAQCDQPNCRKWRRLPPGTVVENTSRWYCRMNPDKRYNSCDILEEPYDEKNEILLTDQDWKVDKKSKRKRKHDSEKNTQGLNRKKVQVELQRRRDRLTEILSNSESHSWQNLTTEDLKLLHLHAAEDLEATRKTNDLNSALNYFENREEECTQLRRVLSQLESCLLRKSLMQSIEDMQRWSNESG